MGLLGGSEDPRRARRSRHGRLHFAQFAPCSACLTHTVFYWPPLHIYRIEAVAAKPDQDAERVGALHAAGTKNAQASHELVAVKWVVSG